MASTPITQRRTSRKSLPRVLRKFSQLTLSLLEDRCVPAITGLVYQDFNANGALDLTGSIANNGQGTTPTAVDRGMAGVEVTAYTANNTVAATATTEVTGAYSLNVGGAGPFRVEFTNLPAGVFFGPQGASNGSAIQFIDSANAANVNLGIVRPEDFSPNNPMIAASTYVVGGIANFDLNPGAGVVVNFPYSAGSADSDPNRANHQNPTGHDLTVQMRTVGATWGLAYDGNTNKLFASAFMKRTTGFGPNGPGAVYSMGITGTQAGVHADLNSIFGDFPAGNLTNLYTDNNGQPVPFRQNITSFDYWFKDGLQRFTDSAGVVRELGWDAVGKIALGGLDVNADGSKLYTMALGDRRLYEIPATGPLNGTTVKRFNLPLPSTVTGTSLSNPLGDLRPFAVEYHRGLVYIGAVNSAESTQNSAHLRAYVFAFDPALGQFVDSQRRATTTASVFEFALNYDRGQIHQGHDPDPTFPSGFSPPDAAEWNAWSPVHKMVQHQPFALGRSGYPQPMMTGISFDTEGNITLGIRDRSGDQFGRNVPINPDAPNDFSSFSMTAGDTLRAGINAPFNLDAMMASATNFAGWTLESNARVGGQGTSPQNTGQGPGGGEFFSDDNFPRDPNVPPVGVQNENDEVSMGATLQLPGFQQVMSTAFDPVRLVGAFNSGGVRWYDTNTGRVQKTYELYVTPTNVSTSTFAKGNGIGDLVAITTPPPIEVGNRVWSDDNRNGVQDAGEAGLANIALQLFAAGPNGTFGNSDDVLLGTAVTDANGNYIFSSGAGSSTTSRLYNLALTANTDYQLRVNPTQAGLGGRNFAIQNADGSTNGDQRDSDVSSLGVTTVHTTVAGAANHSFDIGVAAAANLALGDFVWNDLNNDGRRQAGEPGVDGVTVNLFDSTGLNKLNSMVTAGGGLYRFEGLGIGGYVVEIVPPAGFISSTGKNGAASGPFEPGVAGNENEADHGSGQANGRIRAAVVALADNGDPSNPDSFGTEPNSANLRVDFGLIRPLAVGNFVWNDVNNDGDRDAGEPGLGNIGLTLRTAAGDFVASTKSNSGGGYLFSYLTPGSYRIEIDRSSLPAANFISSSGANSLTGPFEPAPGTAAGDSRDNGSTAGSLVQSPVITLNFGTAPTGEAVTEGGLVNIASDADSNLQMDFGFFQTLSLGNLVWADKNNDGKRTQDEPGIGGVAVRLLNDRGDIITTTSTNPDGLYLFEGLFPVTYSVSITPPTGLVSSTGLNDSRTGPYEPAPLVNPNDDEDKGTQSVLVINSRPVTLFVAGSPGNPSLGGLGNTTVDFGLVLRRQTGLLPSSVSGFVYRDIFNTNGLRETLDGEFGIAATRINLTGTTVDNVPVSLTTTTNILGFYRFLDLMPGSYTISEIQPRGFFDGIDTIGSLSGTIPANDVLTVVLDEDQHGIEYNFGEVLGAAVFGYVYEDLNRNRRFDTGEPGIPNVTVTLAGIAYFGTPMSRLLTAADSLGGLVATTDAYGRWEFPQIPAGRYILVETQPVNFLDFFESVQEPRIRPVLVANDIFDNAVLDYNEVRGPLNYGEVRDPNDPTKRNFLGSSPGGQNPSTTPPVSVDPGQVNTNPAFSVTTGTPDNPAYIVTAPDAGRSPLIRVFDYASGSERFRFFAYEVRYTGGVRVATGDYDGDGIPDIITATGQGGGPRVRVFNGLDGSLLRDFFAYEENFRGGVFVAAADITGDGKVEIITGTEQGGGPRVTVFDAVSNNRIRDFFAFNENQRGGVRVAAADVNGDKLADIVTTAGRGTQTRVRIFDGANLNTISDFIPYAPSFTGGVHITAGDLNGDGLAEVITGADLGGGPHVQVFNSLSGASIYSFFADDPNYRGGIRLATEDVNGDGNSEIVTGTGLESAARIRIWENGALTPLEEFYAFDAGYTGGVYVG